MSLRSTLTNTFGFGGQRPARHVTYCVIACPAGACFPGGGAGVTLWISTRYSRASLGGTGAAAAVITPIIGLRSEDFSATVGDGAAGRYTRQLREHLLDLQYGRAEDGRGWMRRVL